MMLSRYCWVVGLYESGKLEKKHECSQWWTSSSDALIYPSIFAFPLLPLHCWSTTMHPCTDATTHNHTCTHFIGPISLIWWIHVLWFTCFISILSNPNVHPPTIQPITNPCTAWSGTYYSFTLDEPYAHFLVCHLYQLACIYLSLQRRARQFTHMSFPQNSELALTPRITSHSPHTISHHITLPHNPTVFTLYHTWRWSLTPRSHPQSPIGFMLRSLAP